MKRTIMRCWKKSSLLPEGQERAAVREHVARAIRWLHAGPRRARPKLYQSGRLVRPDEYGRPQGQRRIRLAYHRNGLCVQGLGRYLRAQRTCRCRGRIPARSQADERSGQYLAVGRRMVRAGNYRRQRRLRHTQRSGRPHLH